MSDAAGGTALHIAAAKSFPPVVRALLAAEADRGVRNAAGRLALDLASDRATAEAFRR